MRYRYTKKGLDTLVKNIVVVYDTREQQNEHILTYFNKKGIKYKKRKLDEGDYTFYIESNAETKPLGILKDTWFDNAIIIERKANLEELSGNLTEKDGHSERKRFENELIRSQKKTLFLVIENGSWADMIFHNYDTQYASKAFTNSLNSFQQKYDFDIACMGSNRKFAAEMLKELRNTGMFKVNNVSDASLEITAKKYCEDKNKAAVGCFIFRKFEIYLKEYFKEIEE